MHVVSAGAPDATLLNLNLMLVRGSEGIDRQVYVPLGPLYLAGVLKRDGWTVELLDYQLMPDAESFDPARVVAAVPAPGPVIGISCMANLLPFAVLVAQKLKHRFPDRVIVLGGVGPSPVARELAEAFPFLDHIVEGEGELAIVDILNGRADRLPHPHVVDDLESLPLPAYDLIDFRDYDAAPSIITARGCPFRCTFCTEPYNFGGRVRLRSIDSVIAEIELVHRLSGRTLFLFQDDILPLKRARFANLLSRLRGLSFPITWKCFARVDLIDAELMAEMARSGCVQIRFGVEAGHNRTLMRIEKQFTIEQAYETVSAAVKHFPSVHVSFIWGYPFETARERQETFLQVERFRRLGATPLLFELSPLPGSPLYRKFSNDLTFSEENYSFYVWGGFENSSRDSATSGRQRDRIYDLVRAHPRIFSGFYRYSSTLTRAQEFVPFGDARRPRARNEYDL